MGSLEDRLPAGWRKLVSTRITMVLVFVVALLSIATGIVHIGQEAVDFGPLGPLVPDAVQQAMGFTGTLTGFALLGGVFMLSRGLRAGWWLAVLLLPLTLVQGLLQASQYSLPLVVFSLVALPVLLSGRRFYDVPLSLTGTQLAAGIALASVQAYGTFGAFALREDFDGIETLLEAFYFTLVTSSTVGYGDITAQTEEAMLFTMSVVVLGVASFGIAIGAIVGPAIQARLSRTLGKMTDSQLQQLDGHVLVLGYGDLTEPIIEELETADVSFAVVTDDREAAEGLTAREIPVVAADPGDEEPLERANIGRASSVLIATNRDAEDALVILTARECNPDARIVAAATDRENMAKLERAGADSVISPAQLGGHLLVQSALGEDRTAVIDELLGT